MDELHDLRDREAELTNEIEEKREKDNPDQQKLDDLVDKRTEVRDQIAERGFERERAERDVAVEQRW